MSMTPLRVAVPKSVMKPMIEATNRTRPRENVDNAGQNQFLLPLLATESFCFLGGNLR